MGIYKKIANFYYLFDFNNHINNNQYVTYKMTVINVDIFDLKNHNCIDDKYLQHHNIKIGQSYILDIHKINNTCLENIVKMIYEKYIESINETHYIEFYVDKITASKCIIYPDETDIIVSTITSLNVTDISYFFTEFTNDDYKYKSFTDKNINIVSLMPYVHVNFSLSHIYGYVNNANNDNYILNVNILKKQSNSVIIYNDVTSCSNHSITCESILCETNVTEDMINYEFFNALLYNSYKDGYTYMDLIKHRNSIWVKNIDTKTHTLQCLTYELDNIKSNKICFNNRFLQRFHIKEFIHPTFMTHFFNNETGGSTINTTNEYESIISVDITSNNLHVIRKLIDHVCDSYNIRLDHYSVNSIIRQGNNELNDKISHENECDIIIYYLLDGKSIEFEFYDKTKICLIPSSIIFLSGYLKHEYISHSYYSLLCIKIKVLIL